jgi:hypothetical protein
MMSTNQRTRPNQRRRPPSKRPAAVDIWRPAKPLPEVEPISVPPEVGALLRSLGDPPVTGGTKAAHYFNAVIERAAAVAIALAVSADLLADTHPPG